MGLSYNLRINNKSWNIIVPNTEHKNGPMNQRKTLQFARQIQMHHKHGETSTAEIKLHFFTDL